MAEEEKPDAIHSSDESNDKAKADDEQPSTESDESRAESDADEVVHVPPPDKSEDESKAVGGRKLSFDGINNLFLVLMIVFAFFLGSFAVTNSDVWMHLATGKLIVEGDFTFGVDPYSYPEGREWIHHSWLFDVVLYLLYSWFGGAGVVFLKGLGVAGLAFVMLRAAQPVNDGDPRRPGLWPAVALILLAVVAMSPRLLLQPTLISMIFLALTLYLLHRESESPRHLWLIPPLFLLWVNLDEWFILGPLTVGAYLLGCLLQRRLASPAPSRDLRTLAMVFGVGFLACFVNPFTYRAFILPPEMGFIVVGVQESWGFTLLPDAMTAGGRVLAKLNQYADFIPSLQTPFASARFSNTAAGLNIAGVAYFVLLVLGLFSFAARSYWDGKNGEWLPRLLVWIPFAVMGVLQVRLVGFFAVATGVVCVRNFLECSWPIVTQAKPPEAAGRTWFIFGRLMTVIGFLVMGFLIWPGWLHSAIGGHSSHRVAWSMEPNPSEKKIAERLKEFHSQGNVFAFSLVTPNYCAYYAPKKVKNILDFRFHIFASTVDEYIAIRESLRKRALEANIQVGGRQPQASTKQASAWEEIFRRRKINQVVTHYRNNDATIASYLVQPMAGFAVLNAPETQIIAGWRDGDAQRFAKETTDFDRAAFAEVPKDRRPPQPATAAQSSDYWHAYLHGNAGETAALHRAAFYRFYYLARRDWWHLPFQRAQFVRRFVSRIPPAVVTGNIGALALASLYTTPTGSPYADGLAAMPVLQMRNARQAIAKAPDEATARLELLLAVETLATNEDAMLGRVRMSDTIRHMIRRNQLITAYQQLLKIRNDHIPSHLRLAELYARLNCFDLFAHHMDRVVELWPNNRPKEADFDSRKAWEKRHDDWKRQYDGYKTNAKQVQKILKTIRYQYDVRTAKQPKFAQFMEALLGRYQFGKQQPQHIILAKRADEIFEKINIKSVDMKFRMAFMVEAANLSLLTGKAYNLADAIKDWRYKSEGKWRYRLPVGEYWRFKAITSAVIGDYVELDKSLAELESLYTEGLQETAKQLIAYEWGLAVLNAPNRILMLDPKAVEKFVHPSLYLNQTLRPMVEIHLMRGLGALEAGETKQAKQYFNECLDWMGRFAYPERAIVRSYAEHLNKQIPD